MNFAYDGTPRPTLGCTVERVKLWAHSSDTRYMTQLMSTSVFVPGHVTGFFAVNSAEERARTGSRGAGVTLTDGVNVTVRPDDGGSTLRVNEAVTSVEAVEYVLEELAAPPVFIEAETPLPLGAGFGVSGALALGTAMAVTREFTLDRTLNECITIAHKAEVRAGTGLGDVVAQAHGGISIRAEPGAPAYNTLDTVLGCPRVEYCVFGSRSTETVLAGDTQPLNAAGERALEQLQTHPTPSQFMKSARAFARETSLASATVSSAIEAVAEGGDVATMAMLGETVFCFGEGLSQAGYDPTVSTVTPSGAALEE